MSTRYPKKYEGDELGASHINKMGDDIEYLRMNSTGQVEPQVVRQFQVTGTGAEDPLTESQNPQLFQIRFMFYDDEAEPAAWVIDEELHDITDDDDFQILDPIETEPSVNDRVSATFDRQRGCWLPVTGGGGGESNTKCGDCGDCVDYQPASFFIEGLWIRCCPGVPETVEVKPTGTVGIWASDPFDCEP